MPCGWEGNRRSGVALAARHRLQLFIHGLRKGDKRPPTLLMRYGTLYLTFTPRAPTLEATIADVCSQAFVYVRLALGTMG